MNHHDERGDSAFIDFGAENEKPSSPQTPTPAAFRLASVEPTWRRSKEHGRCEPRRGWCETGAAHLPHLTLPIYSSCPARMSAASSRSSASSSSSSSGGANAAPPQRAIVGHSPYTPDSAALRDMARPHVASFDYVRPDLTLMAIESQCNAASELNQCVAHPFFCVAALDGAFLS